MANNTVTAVIRGKASFARVLGDPVLNYDKSGKEWKLDVQITKDTVKEIKSLGIGDRVKSKDEYLDGSPYLSFKQAEFRKDGKPNFPIKVVDIKGNDWDQSKLIGNGSDIDVKFVVMDHGTGKKKGVYIRSIRVLKLVEYGGKSEFDAIDEDDEFYLEAQAAATLEADRANREDEEFKKDFDLDDDIDDVI